jgi:hypothetical protein
MKAYTQENSAAGKRGGGVGEYKKYHTTFDPLARGVTYP